MIDKIVTPPPSWQRHLNQDADQSQQTAHERVSIRVGLHAIGLSCMQEARKQATKTGACADAVLRAAAAADLLLAEDVLMHQQADGLDHADGVVDVHIVVVLIQDVV